MPDTLATTHRVDDAELYFEVRGSGPLVVLIGAPMDAAAFMAAADLLAVDHTVLTTDPRGIHRSPLDDPGQDSTPELRADDVARLITHLDAGRAVVVGSSGGAVTALALAQSHPDLVHTVVVHEAPLQGLLDDRDALRAETDAMVERYRVGDALGAWTLFLESARIPVPAEVMVAREPQAVADERRWFLHEMTGSSNWLPDLDALRATPVRVVVGIGSDSAGEVCDRTSRALAAELGVEPTMFPGGHIGFVDDPAAFVTRLREVLAG
ncbi:alpha/beta fold hydrolase [Pseudonocardia abyssalis]|uniref:Alpha/beta hydrolase n=1 Tax=Pseudonocardia abyssalis TaxID=2792008 RepID=A0ABS6UXP4_9PSEU|nr:alpha/beta hydrolase [Pseudonocardia abyssalis]MBW0114857.1 alpha/beta hydrolase [Pseudonocardia abyssalis]MBW0137047.1 alpha/beta hydrolase [Pseudonocardia abyssalis]